MHDASAVRRIALMNQKGGVGKTTTAVNLSAAIAEAGHRVLLIDLDPQAHASLHLGIDPETADSSVYDLLLEPDLDPVPIAQRVRDNLWVLPSETDLAAAETELANVADRQQRLDRAVERLLASLPIDHILIDCPPSLGVLTTNGLVAAREVMIPMQAHFLALQGMGKLLETVQLVRQINAELRVTGVILCMHDGQTNLTQEVVSDITGFLESQKGTDTPWSDARVFGPPIRRNVKLAECPSFGKTIFDYAPWAPGAMDYRKLASAIVAAGESEDLSTAEIEILQGRAERERTA